jgi:hypothetical protein
VGEAEEEEKEEEGGGRVTTGTLNNSVSRNVKACQSGSNAQKQKLKRLQ